MNYLIQRGKIRSQVINVPEGLPEILSDITREVLRCQPTTECLCEFIIDYLHSVILTREKARMAKMIMDRALRVVDEIVADMCVCDIHKAKADQMCEAMEECFRRFLAQRRCEKNIDNEIIKFNEIDMLDELIEKCKFSEDELKITRPVIEAAYQKFVDAYMTAQENTEGTEALYQYFREREMKRIEDRMRHEAAIKIQANVRGFLVRRSLFLNKEVVVPIEEPSETIEFEMDVAARKIQKFFRHHMSFIHKQMDMAFGSRVSLAADAKEDRDIPQQLHTEDLDTKPLIPQDEDKHLDDHDIEVYEQRLDHYEEMIPETTTEVIQIHHETQEVIVDGEVVHNHEETHITTTADEPMPEE